MTSVRNRLPRLSGNRWFIFLVAGLFAAACSPKVRPVAVQPKNPETQKTDNKNPQNAAKPVVKTPSIALLLPFGLDHLKPGAPYSASGLKEADIALDYYRGFKLALDSLAGQGYNFKLRVLDSKGQKDQSARLALNAGVRSADLIVGPVFPDDLKAFINTYPVSRAPVVSPLSAASPAIYKNNAIVTVMPPLEYHAWKTAQYINDRIKPKKVFVLKSGFSDENEYIIPFKRAIDSLSKKHIQLVYLTVKHGQLGTLIPQLNAEGKNIFVMPGTDRHFLTVTLRGLDSLNNTYPVTLFGHPSWANFSFLKADILQRLNTHITATDRINYKANDAVTFMTDYRNEYHMEPTAYAIKGFDEGLYFGKLLASGDIKNPGSADFDGIHNDFHFQKKAGQGWVNTHVNVYKYSNFELKKVE